MGTKKVAVVGTRGIDNIKACFLDIFAITEPLADILEDGKVHYLEIFVLAPKLIKIPQLVEHAKKSLDEFKDLSAVEAKEISDFFKIHFDIPNEELEDHIEKGINLIANGYDLVIENINFYKEAEAWVNGFKNLNKEVA